MLSDVAALVVAFLSVKVSFFLLSILIKDYYLVASWNSDEPIDDKWKVSFEYASS